MKQTLKAEGQRQGSGVSLLSQAQVSHFKERHIGAPFFDPMLEFHRNS